MERREEIRRRGEKEERKEERGEGDGAQSEPACLLSSIMRTLIMNQSSPQLVVEQRIEG